MNWDFLIFQCTLRRQQPAEVLVDGDQATEEARLADWHSGFCVNLVCILYFLVKFSIIDILVVTPI